MNTKLKVFLVPAVLLIASIGLFACQSVAAAAGRENYTDYNATTMAARIHFKDRVLAQRQYPSVGNLVFMGIPDLSLADRIRFHDEIISEIDKNEALDGYSLADRIRFHDQVFSQDQ